MKCLRVSLLATLNLVLLVTIGFICWKMFALLWDGERVPHNNRKEWEERKKNCEEEYEVWYDQARQRSSYNIDYSYIRTRCINERISKQTSSSNYVFLDSCCKIPDSKIMIILPNNKEVPYPRLHSGYEYSHDPRQYDNDRIYELKLLKVYALLMGFIALAIGIAFGMICVRFFKKIRRPAGPAEMKPIEELESWAATRNKKNKAMISDSSDDETDDSFFWLHLRLKAMSSKTEKLDALSQTLKETNDYLTSDVVDLILTAFPEEEEAMEAFVIIEPYLLTSVTPRDTEYSLDVVVED